MNKPIDQVAVSVNEFCASVGIGRTFFYQEVKANRIKIVKAGSRTLIPISEKAAYLERLPAGNS